jgi:hypothetical protein
VRLEPPAAPPPSSPPSPRPRVVGVRRRDGDAATEPTPDGTGGDGDGEPAPTRWRWLALGFAAAWLLPSFLPHGFDWFLAAIPHEMGHATVGSLLGRPSAPAISLAGHAWAGIGEFRPWLSWAMALGLGTLAWLQRTRPVLAIGLGLVALALPFVARMHLAEVLISLGGHFGELAFAAYCYALCWSEGHTGTPQERIASAMCGALLQAGSLRLSWGLLTDAAVRAHYEVSGSLGMKNDYLVIAEDLCACRLQTVVGWMLVPGLLALPLGLWWGAVRQRRAHLED